MDQAWKNLNLKTKAIPRGGGIIANQMRQHGGNGRAEFVFFWMNKDRSLVAMNKA